MAKVPSSVDDYLSSLPDDRREALEAIRSVINKNVDSKVEEGIQYRMVGWYVPHSVYPDGYHCNPKDPLPFASLASQKNHMALYLFCSYVVEEEQERFIADWKKTGKKLDMGKSCVRFKKLEDVPLDVIGRAIKRMSVKKFLTSYEEVKPGGSRPLRKNASTKKKTAKKKTAVKKKAAAKKKTTKKVAAKKSATKKRAAKKATTKKRSKKR